MYHVAKQKGWSVAARGGFFFFFKWIGRRSVNVARVLERAVLTFWIPIESKGTSFRFLNFSTGLAKDRVE